MLAIEKQNPASKASFKRAKAIMATKRRRFRPCISPLSQCSFHMQGIRLPVGQFSVGESRFECRYNPMIDGHAYTNRAQQTNGSHSRQKHKAGTTSQENRAIVWPQVSIARLTVTRHARLRFSPTPEDHFRSWLLLASTSWLLSCSTTKVKVALLASQAVGKPEARLAQHRETPPC
jgi:hypothetical protein